jgi:hypothetical protein
LLIPGSRDKHWRDILPSAILHYGERLAAILREVHEDFGWDCLDQDGATGETIQGGAGARWILEHPVQTPQIGNAGEIGVLMIRRRAAMHSMILTRGGNWGRLMRHEDGFCMPLLHD